MILTDGFGYGEDDGGEEDGEGYGDGRENDWGDGSFDLGYSGDGFGFGDGWGFGDGEVRGNGGSDLGETV